MRILNRDIKILKLISMFGFMKTSTLMELVFVEGSEEGRRCRCARRLTVLFGGGLLVRERDRWSGEFLYCLSLEGFKVLEANGFDAFRRVVSVPWSKVVHDCYVQDVLVEFFHVGYRKYYPEKLIKRLALYNNLIPDLAIKQDEDWTVLIEVELSRKSFQRICKKINLYSELKDKVKVLYICKDQITIARIKSIYSKQQMHAPFFVTTLDNFFNNAQEKIELITRR